MGRAGVLQEVRVMRFAEVVGRLYDGRLSCEEAADVLGMSVSSFYRWRRRFEAEGGGLGGWQARLRGGGRRWTR